MTTVRYIVRPSHIHRTPAALARILGVPTRRYPSSRPQLYNFDRSLFTIYPHPQNVITSDTTSYHQLHQFFSANKVLQRLTIQAHELPIPPTFASPNHPYLTSTTATQFVVRPLRHFGGRGYRITTDPTDFTNGREYISELFRKTHEYRIVCVFGNPLITLRKRVPPHLRPEQPWNHTHGSYFQTIQDVSRCNLATYTDVYDRLRRNPIIQHAHIVGVDVLFNINDRRYVITEFNACPALAIDNNLQKVADHVLSHPRLQ